MRRRPPDAAAPPKGRRPPQRRAPGARPYTYTFITEAPNGEFAIAGTAKTADDMKAMRHGQPVG